MRIAKLFLAFLALYIFAVALHAQSPSGSISGLVLDPTARVIAGADVVAVNDATGVKYVTRTNGEGIYVLSNLLPGQYRLQISKVGFKALIKPDVTLSVQDALSLNFTLPVGAFSDSVTVEGGTPLVNSQSAAVSTVIDRKLVENLPLNGRSFNTLLQLTPGVVIAPANSATQGQFSVAGQRTSANNFLIDGASANFGVAPTFGLGSSGTGSAQAFSALGGTSSLVSVDALQEFRVETSSFAAEFGRSPGGQIVLTTRSGSNDFHGGIYEYFRNDVLDANDWFANHAGRPRAAERHNDFGGFVGGPIQHDKTFFFASYEGARLRQPTTNVVSVPSQFARNAASSQIAPFLNAYPLPDDRTLVPGVYVANFTGNYSNPSTLDAGSVRLDHNFGSRFSLFARYNEAPSETAARSDSLNETDTTRVRTRTVSLAANFTFTPQIANAFRANYSKQNSALTTAIDSFGGAVVPSPNLLDPNPLDPSKSFVIFGSFDTGVYSTGPSSTNSTTQLDIADDLTLVRGAHQWKFGGDYRAIDLNLHPFNASFDYVISQISDFVNSGQVLVQGASTRPSEFLSRSTSLFAQDTWQLHSRLTLTYGLRWELYPAPSPRGQTQLAAWENVHDPANLTLAAAGTPLWSLSYTNLAPRMGAAYRLTPSGDLVLRAGWGIFYDLGSAEVGNLASVFPNVAVKCCATVSLPLAGAAPFIPALTTQPPYVGVIRGITPDLSLPRSYQRNVALEKSFGSQQALSLTYVGQSGRKLTRQEALPKPNANFLTNFFLLTNGAYSNYDALQVQYRRPLARRLQALANYTWSHSLDNASNDVLQAISNTLISAARDYGSSSFDVRHSFSAALIYQLPHVQSGRALAAVTRDWSVETDIVSRTGFPFNGSVLTANIGGVNPRPDLVAGQPVWISDSSVGGGKRLNPAAFAKPAAGQQGSERRNDITGFGLTQVDFSVNRKFPIRDALALQFRVDAFNLFNHPNFANPSAFIGVGPSFLRSASMLNQGLGGLNPLFQEGGPRSLQAALKLTF
jgi:hypothetical protein